MASEIRIPTLLGLGVLITGIAVGVFLTTQRQLLRTSANTSVIPKNITVINLSDSSAVIFWQTDQSLPGFIQAGPTRSLYLTAHDDRDLQAPQKHYLHFVTLQNLIPNTTYYYKINTPPNIYPAQEPLSFKTLPPLAPGSYQPIIGQVFDTNLQPVEEAIITLDIPGAQSLAAVTKGGGNFILPLSKIRTSNFTQSFNIPQSGMEGRLTIHNLQNTAHASIKLPLLQTTLPPITLGQDFDFTVQIASETSNLSRYDLNSDRVINAVDLGIILKSLGTNPKRRDADLNHDGVVDQKDVDVLIKINPNITPPPQPVSDN